MRILEAPLSLYGKYINDIPTEDYISLRDRYNQCPGLVRAAFSNQI